MLIVVCIKINCKNYKLHGVLSIKTLKVVNKHFRNYKCHLFSPHFLFFIFLFYAASQRVNIHIVYMHVHNEINKIVCAFAFSDGFKPKSDYNKSSAPKNIKLLCCRYNLVLLSICTIFRNR